MSADRCGAVRGPLVCDRAPGHDGEHRGYLEDVDEVLFWPAPGSVIARLEREIVATLEHVAQPDRRIAGERLIRKISEASS